MESIEMDCDEASTAPPTELDPWLTVHRDDLDDYLEWWRPLLDRFHADVEEIWGPHLAGLDGVNDAAHELLEYAWEEQESTLAVKRYVYAEQLALSAFRAANWYCAAMLSCGGRPVHITEHYVVDLAIDRLEPDEREALAESLGLVHASLEACQVNPLNGSAIVCTDCVHLAASWTRSRNGGT